MDYGSKAFPLEMRCWKQWPAAPAAAPSTSAKHDSRGRITQHKALHLLLAFVLGACLLADRGAVVAHQLDGSISNQGLRKQMYYGRHLAQAGTCSRGCGKYLENDCVKWSCRCGPAGSGTYTIGALLLGCDFSSLTWACCMQANGQECRQDPADCTSSGAAFAISPHNGACYCAGVDYMMTYKVSETAGPATFYLMDKANKGNVPWQTGGSSSTSGVCGGSDAEGSCDPSYVCKVTKTFQDLGCPATCPGTSPSCRAPDLSAADPDPFPCTRGVYNPGSRDEPPSQDKCCQATCGDYDLSSSTPTKFDCGPGSVFNPSTEHMTKPSQQKCCLQTCTRPKPGSPEAFDCKGGAFNKDASSSTDVRAEVCCTPTCSSTDVTGAKPDSQYKCSEGWKLNPQAANNYPPSDVACCVQQSNPSNTADVAVAISGPDEKQLVGDVFVFTVVVEVLDGRQGASGIALDVNLSDGLQVAGSLPIGCMLSADPQRVMCIGLGSQALGTQKRLPLKITATKAGVHTAKVVLTSADGNQGNNKGSATATVLGACCDAFSRTCSNTLSATDCDGVFTATKDCSRAPDCWATCSSADPVRSPGQAFTCNPGTTYNKANAARFPPTNSLCCLPTCGNPDVTSSAAKPFDCPTTLRYRLDSSKLGALNPSVCVCCKRAPLDPPDVSFTLRPASLESVNNQFEVVVGDVVQFDLNVTADLGLDDVEGVTVAVALGPDNTGLIATSATGCKVDGQQQTLTCSPFNLPLASTRSIRFSVKTEQAGRLVVRATVSCDMDPDPDNNNKQVALAIRGACCSPAFEKCVEVDERACSKASGDFFGKKSCSQVTCTKVVRGSCCVPSTGQCSMKVKSACDALEAATVFAAGVSCANSQCGMMRGACCTVDTGACKVRRQKFCRQPANKWSFSDQCGQDFCPAPTKTTG